ncbi:MAG: hypothetical protein H6772_04665 [Pseudomonadales bacterium]|nr:hypothetical protein [Pseudomonadales bacterium]
MKELSLDRNAIVAAASRARHFLRNNITNTFDGPAGLVSGLVYREQEFANQMETKENIPNNPLGETWKNILTLAENLPMPFWNGIHPKIARELMKHLNNQDDPFWNEPMMNNVVKTRKTRVVNMEPGINRDETQPQLDFLEKYLPKGSLSTIFITRGNQTVWGRVPLANAFAENPHQMSLPALATKIIKGINTLLLTSSESKTVPSEWKEPFPIESNHHAPIEAKHKSPTMAWMNLHQIGHCMVIPTCWEYLDRNYSLITPQELLQLTELRLKALNEWYLRYYGFNGRESKPDTTTYLYEIKIVENALYALSQTDATTELDSNKKTHLKEDGTEVKREEIFWFKGVRIKEIAAQLDVSEDQIWKGVMLMDKYLMDNHHSRPTDAVYNSAVHSTDIGTHPTEEVIVDVIAQARLGILPKEYSYWNEYTQMVFDIWKKWEEKEN